MTCLRGTHSFSPTTKPRTSREQGLCSQQVAKKGLLSEKWNSLKGTGQGAHTGVSRAFPNHSCVSPVNSLPGGQPASRAHIESLFFPLKNQGSGGWCQSAIHLHPHLTTSLEAWGVFPWHSASLKQCRHCSPRFPGSLFL